jgi:hypothetical protein
VTFNALIVVCALFVRTETSAEFSVFLCRASMEGFLPRNLSSARYVRRSKHRPLLRTGNECLKKLITVLLYDAATRVFQDHERAYFDSADWVLGKVNRQTDDEGMNRRPCLKPPLLVVVLKDVANQSPLLSCVVQQGASSDGTAAETTLKPKLQVRNETLSPGSNWLRRRVV